MEPSPCPTDPSGKWKWVEPNRPAPKIRAARTWRMAEKRDIRQSRTGFEKANSLDSLVLGCLQVTPDLLVCQRKSPLAGPRIRSTPVIPKSREFGIHLAGLRACGKLLLGPWGCLGKPHRLVLVRIWQPVYGDFKNLLPKMPEHPRDLPCRTDRKTDYDCPGIDSEQAEWQPQQPAADEVHIRSPSGLETVSSLGSRDEAGQHLLKQGVGRHSFVV